MRINFYIKQGQTFHKQRNTDVQKDMLNSKYKKDTIKILKRDNS